MIGLNKHRPDVLRLVSGGLDVHRIGGNMPGRAPAIAEWRHDGRRRGWRRVLRASLGGALVLALAAAAVTVHLRFAPVVPDGFLIVGETGTALDPGLDSGPAGPGALAANDGSVVRPGIFRRADAPASSVAAKPYPAALPDEGYRRD